MKPFSKLEEGIALNLPYLFHKLSSPGLPGLIIINGKKTIQYFDQAHFSVITGADSYTLRYYRGNEKDENPLGQYGYVQRGTVVKVLGQSLYRGLARNWFFIEAVIVDGATGEQRFEKGFISNEAVKKVISIHDQRFKKAYMSFYNAGIKEHSFRFLKGKDVKKFGAVYNSKAGTFYVRKLPHPKAGLVSDSSGFISNYENVFIVSEHNKGWYLISYRNGKMGYIEKKLYNRISWPRV